MFGRLKQKLSTLYRNLVYLSQQDYKRGLAWMLHEGRRLEFNAPSDLRHCPVCEHELERVARADGVIVTMCPRWQFHPTHIPFPDAEAHTDPRHEIGESMRAFHQAMQHGAGPHTAAVQAAPRRTVKLSPDSDRRQ